MLPALALVVSAIGGGLFVHHSLVPAVLEHEPGRIRVAVRANDGDVAAGVEGDVDFIERRDKFV